MTTIPQRFVLPPAPAHLRDRVAFASDDGQRLEGFVVGHCCPGGKHLFDVLADETVPWPEERRVHQGIPAGRVSVLAKGAFGTLVKERTAA